MSRSIVLSNGELAVALDSRGQVRDIYYPHIGLEDHVRGHYLHRVGVWVDGRLSWTSDEEWSVVVRCEEEALASDITATNANMQVELRFTDIVYNERSIFLRQIAIKNLSDKERDIKLYVAHQFELYKAHGGDTAYYDPQTHSIIHYKGQRVFLISGTVDGEPFQDYVTGLANFAGHEGSHKDAEDGALTKNPIEHGPADSVIGFYGTYKPAQIRTVEYWMAAARTISEAQEIDATIRNKKTPSHLIRTASDFWKAWVNAYNWNFMGLSPEQVALFKHSLMFIRSHVDLEGGVIASLDSDTLNYGLDTYSYVWPRDGAYAILALDAAGDGNAARRFFEFCKQVLFKDGYLMHKYLPDKSLGSSWHPWVRNGKSELPIQEDETAIAVYALGVHYAHTHDVEFLESMYDSLLEKAANFMVSYMDPETHLPLASYDLWEEKRGVSTYTASCVYGALEMAAELSRILGKEENENKYREAAKGVKEGILKYLWDEKEGIFIKHIDREGGVIKQDKTLDASSVYGVFFFEVLGHDDQKVERAFAETVKRLSHGIPAGGLARYEGDNYYRNDRDSAGNPWIVTTLWYAEYLIAKAKKQSDFARVLEILSWVVKHSQTSGILSEQLNPQTGEQISVAPLTWSHSAYVSAVIKYLNKLEELGICHACNPAP
jgi:GH15 family glucan-1,4-alpha-glucosidase